MLIDELRTINCILFPDWASTAAANLSHVFQQLSAHPARSEITLLIDSRTLSDDWQESANLLIWEAVLELDLEVETAEDLSIVLTGAITPQDWQTIQPLISFRIPIASEDLQLVAQPEIAQLPVLSLPGLAEPAIYAAVQQQSWCRWGDYFVAQGQLQPAIDFYGRCLCACPERAELYLKLSDLWSQAGEPAAAILSLQQGIEHCPPDPALYFWLILRLRRGHADAAARAIAQQAEQLFPNDYVFKLFSHLLLPERYSSPEEIDQYRAQFRAGLDHLIQNTDLREPGMLAQALAGVKHHTNFLLAYQAKDDRLLQRQYGQFLHQIMAASYPQWSQPRPMPPLGNGQRIRIGYLSSFLCSWSGTVLFLNWLKYADLTAFELYAYHIGDQVDAVTEQFRAYSSQFHYVPHDFEQIAQQVTKDELHLLIFPELGMFGRTLCLAALRLAPIQCMAWGQPVTSGIPTVDYFLSSQTMEPENGQEHYSEKLVRLPGVGISYPTIRVQNVQRDRAAFGLRDDAAVYLSSQAPYKYLPQHDWLYAQIARRVPNAQIMFLRAGIPPERLTRAFAAVGLDSQDYCLFSPVLPRQEYFDLILLSDIYLDTPEWSGGNTTLDALACALPVVTYPGEFMRGRHSSGFLQTIGVTATLAADAAEYVEIAVRLADSTWRQAVRDALRQAVPMLFDNPTATRNLEAFLKQAVTLV